MVCIYCGGPTMVTNSRKQKRSNAVWRRRECQACGAVFTSNEQADLAGSLMVSDDVSGKLWPFNRDRLFTSIWESCKHRPSALQDATSLTNTVVHRLLQSGKNSPGKLSSKQIASATYQLLIDFDATAAAVYKAYHLA